MSVSDRLPCGHPLSAVVTGGEGTSYCGECAALSRQTREARQMVSRGLGFENAYTVIRCIDALAAQVDAESESRRIAEDAIEAFKEQADMQEVRAEEAEARVDALQEALASCLRFAPGGIDDVADRHHDAVQTWVDAWKLIEGTPADWRPRAVLASVVPAAEEDE